MICPGWMKDRLIGWMLLIILRSSVVCHSSWKISGQDWCSLDSGESILSDQYGIKHSVYVSLTRDGSVWIRFGTDHASSEWNLENEARFPTQLSVLEKIVVNVLETINYTDSWCALTDLDLRLRADSGWHPSYMTVFDPKEKQIKTIVYRHHRDCLMSTNISLSPDKQGIVCEGGRKSACSQRNLPERGHQSSTLFLLNVNFDPNGPGNWECSDDELQNSYTFKGSYYYAYVKMASCDTPSESRYLGHEATMRPNKDESLSNLIFLPDPLHGAISDGIIGGWRVFISIQSVRHEIYFQIWRPSVDQENTYSLVGQTFFKPTELRYTEINLDPSQFIPIRKGDLLGLYFPDSNPVGWSSVPCAFKDQLPKFHAKPDRVSIGQTFNFDTLPQSAEPVCRQYSFSAVFANRSTAKQIEDWVCPTAGAGPLFGSHRPTNPKDDSLIQEDAIHGFNVFLSMWTQGQVHVLNAGQSIELDCEFYAEKFDIFNNPVFWKKYQLQEEAEVNFMGNILPPFFDTGRFEVTLTRNPPHYRLKISDLALEDSGNYTCEVRDLSLEDRGLKSSVIATVTHYIFVRAQVQRIFFSDNTNLSLSFIEDSPGQVRCTSIGGYPPPELQVLIGDREITGLFTLSSSTTLHGNKGLRLMIYQLERWTDRLSLKAEDDGKQITCVASVSGLATNVSTSAQVSVKYGPIIKCSPSFAYLHQKNAFLQCEVRANPGLTSLFWTIDGNGTTLTEGEIIEDYWTLLTLVFDRSDDVIETQLFMRKTTSSSFRKYTLIAENSITSTRRDVELFQKTTSSPLVELSTRKFNDNNDAKYNIIVAPSLTSSSTNIASTVTSSIVVVAVLTLFSSTRSVFQQLISCHVPSN